MDRAQIEASDSLTLRERHDELDQTLRYLRAERDMIVAAIRATHPALPSPDLRAEAKALRRPMYAALDETNSRIFPVREEMAAIRRELSQRPNEERDAA